MKVGSSHLMQGKKNSETKLFQDFKVFFVVFFLTGLLFALFADIFYYKIIISYLNCS